MIKTVPQLCRNCAAPMPLTDALVKQNRCFCVYENGRLGVRKRLFGRTRTVAGTVLRPCLLPAETFPASILHPFSLYHTAFEPVLYTLSACTIQPLSQYFTAFEPVLYSLSACTIQPLSQNLMKFQPYGYAIKVICLGRRPLFHHDLLVSVLTRLHDGETLCRSLDHPALNVVVRCFIAVR